MTQLFRFREEMLQRFPGKTRRRWYDPEDAFSDVILKVYRKAMKGDLKAPPEKDHWHKFLHQLMRQRFWLLKRREESLLIAVAGAKALAEERRDSKADDPAREAGTLDALAVLVPKVKEALSPKQQTAFFGKAQDMTYKEIASATRTSPGAVRVQGNRANKKMKKLRKRLKDDMVA